jgi:methylmalonyl-CoA mutase N-terminal domain/subunit
MSETETFRLDAGVVVQPAYGPADLEARGIDPAEVAPPGEFPYARGTSPDGYRSVPLLVKIYSGYGSPADSNARFRKLAEWGTDIIHVAADLPTQTGYDPDHLMSSGEVGRAGVSIASLRDLEVMFDGVPLSSLSRVGMLGNSIGPIALALFLALGERQGLAPGDYVLDLQNDPLKEYVARGTQFLPVEPAVRLALDVVEWSAANAPHWYPLDVCVNHLNAAGAGSSKATAFALANAQHYIETMIERGHDVDSFAPMLQLFVDERDDFFAAVANARATRRIWARMLRERYGATRPESTALQLTAYGHGRESRVDPVTNVGRIMLGSLAYFFGGVQCLYAASYDEVLQLPSEDSARFTVRTLQILRHELGLSLVADPLGGSWFVESLTADLEWEILEALAEVEGLGGAVACIENGHIRSAITDGAVRRQSRFESGIRPLVGVSVHPTTDETGWQVRPSAIDAGCEEQRVRDVVALRREREPRQVAATLREVASACRSGANLVPPVLEAVRAYATVGEICDVFREAFGEWQPDRTF